MSSGPLTLEHVDMRKPFVPALVAAVAFAGLTAPAAAAAPPAPPAQEAVTATPAPPRPSGRLQVRFKPGVTAKGRDAALAKVRGKGHGVRVHRGLTVLNAAVLRVSNPRAVQALLRDDPSVAYVERESRYLPSETPTRELNEVGATAVQAQPDPNLGAGTTIAIIDSPVTGTVSDLNGAGKVANGGSFGSDYDEVPGDDFRDDPCTASACPHGTGVASVAAGEADGAGMVGVAPAAKIRSYDVFRRWSYTDPATGEVTRWISADSGDVASALVQVAEDAQSDPSIVAVNMSMESDFDNRLMRDAIEYLHAVAPRVTVVAAAGNDGSERANFPAGDPYVLSVGATGQVPDGYSCGTSVSSATPWTVTSFSNRGDVDVVAPGRCVAAWNWVDTNGNGAPDAFRVTKVNGTSFAAPMVAGIAALLASADVPVTGDAARAAIIASATGTPTVDSGSGKAHAGAALDLAAGTAPYTALSVDRGGQVATLVGKRRLEVLRVDKADPTPTAPTPVPTAGYGTVTPAAASSPAPPAEPGLTRAYYSYAVPAVEKTSTFALTADGGSGGADIAVAPMKMLSAYDSFEGLPAATGETGSAALVHGERSAYIRSANVRNTSRLDYAYTFGHLTSPEDMPPTATFNVWEPTSPGGVADAALEPVWQYTPDMGRSGADYLVPGGIGGDICAYNAAGEGRYCHAGRYLVGFLTGSSRDDSASFRRYELKLTYPGPTLTASAPTVASSASISGPFKVSWGGNSRAVKWDVAYAVKTKTSTGWRVTSWTPWHTTTAPSSAYFGLNGAPVAIQPGQTYHFRVQAWDSLGNPTVAAVKTTAVPYDDRSPEVVYSTGSTAWTKVGVSDRWLKTASKSSAAGARAALTADASSFTIVGDMCAACGSFKVYVDGVYKKTVSTYRAEGTSVRRVLWSSGSLGSVASHRVTVIVSGTPGRPKVVLDGIAATR